MKKMKEEEIISFKQYYSPNRILVVTHTNRLVELHCPFLVKAKESIRKINNGQLVFVEKTGVTKEEDYVFLIEGQWYYPKHFSILVDPN